MHMVLLLDCFQAEQDRSQPVIKSSMLSIRFLHIPITGPSHEQDHSPKMTAAAPIALSLCATTHHLFWDWQTASQFFLFHKNWELFSVQESSGSLNHKSWNTSVCRPSKILQQLGSTFYKQSTQVFQQSVPLVLVSAQDLGTSNTDHIGLTWDKDMSISFKLAVFYPYVESQSYNCIPN